MKTKSHCSVCAMAKVRVSAAMHDYISKMCKMQAQYNLALLFLGEALIARKEMGRKFNGFTEALGGNPRKAALVILARRVGR